MKDYIQVKISTPSAQAASWVKLTRAGAPAAVRIAHYLETIENCHWSSNNILIFIYQCA